jgi:hypothetical protein
MARRAIETCVVLMASTELQDQVIARYVPTEAIQDGAMVTIGSGVHHLCEFLPIYVPGAGTRSSGLVMREATVHISQVVAGTQGVNQTAYAGSPPQQNPPVPQPQWIILNRQVPPHSRAWLREAAINCVGVKGQSDCDEWPARSHKQGGKPSPGELQPHLSIIHWLHNRRGGSDLGSFYAACGVGSDDVFLAIPMPPAMLGKFNTEDIVPTGLRSQQLC